MEKERTDISSCAACLRDNETAQSKHWCCDCVEALCDNCAKVHKKSKFTTSHKLIRLKEIKNTGSFLLSTSFMCSLHSDLRLAFFCNIHDQLLCQTCLLHSHKDCKNITDIDQLSIRQKYENSKMDHFESMQRQAAKLAESLDQLITIKKENISKLDDQKTEIEESVKKMKEDIMDLLSRLEKDLLSSLTQKHDSCVQQIKEEIADLQRNKELMTIHESDVQLLQKHASDPYKFIIVKKFDYGHDRINDIINSYAEKNKPLEIEFTKNESLVQILDKSFGWVDIKVNKLRSIGVEELKITPRTTTRESPATIRKKYRPSTRGSIATQRDIEISFDRLIPIYRDEIQLVLYTNFETSAAFGENISISRGCFVSPRHLLLCDSHSRCLYRSNLFGSITQRIPLLYFPHDVAKGSDNRALVTAGERGIQIFTMVDGECKPDKFLRPGGKCTAIACVHDQVVVRNGYCKISILDLNGSAFLKINTKYDPFFISVDRSGCIYWTSNNQDEVQCIATERSQYVCKSAGLVGPTGLAADDAGHVFVAGYESANIHRLSNKGLQSVVLDKGINFPWDLDFNVDAQKLLVINNDGMQIQVYTFNK